MSSLHRRALGGGKTTSRKARSRQPSVPTSRPQSGPNSRPQSRGPSRDNSDEDEFGDETNFRLTMLGHLNAIDRNSRPQSKAGSNATSNYSGEDGFSGHEADEHLASGWEDDLRHCMEELGDRNWKRSNMENREHTLQYFNRILTLKYARDVIGRRESDLVATLLKSIKMENSEREVVLAMQALSLTVITLQPASIYEDASPAIKRAISDSSAGSVKAAAIYTLAVISFFGDISDEETIDNLNFLLEIVSSDGAFIDAADQPAPVIAALESYSFLATLIDDLSEDSHDAIDAFAEQLSSSHTSVAIAAGECIALLYEKSYHAAAVESDSDEADSVDSAASSSDNEMPTGTKQYEAYRHTAQLEEQLASLSRVSSKQVSKKDRKSLHSNFADILNSVQHPGHGPRYSTAIRGDGSGEYGSRMVINVSQSSFMRIDRWWKLVRLQGLRRVLRDGFIAHYEHNPAIFEALPIVVQEKKGLSLGASKMRSKHFMGGTKGLLEIPS